VLEQLGDDDEKRRRCLVIRRQSLSSCGFNAFVIACRLIRADKPSSD
jgi:hypothetical protein